eukprot:2026344-Prymnesium_polylepis.1
MTSRRSSCSCRLMVATASCPVSTCVTEKGGIAGRLDCLDSPLLSHHVAKASGPKDELKSDHHKSEHDEENIDASGVTTEAKSCADRREHVADLDDEYTRIN